MMKRKKRLLILLIILTLGLIWGHSMMGPEQSSEESGWVLNWITPLLEVFVGVGNVTEFLVRKLAHFCEFALLGAELLLLFSVFPQEELLSFKVMGTAVAHALFAALTDETIQIFSHRGSQVQDVWLDVAGGTCGAVLMMLFLWITKRKRRI